MSFFKKLTDEFKQLKAKFDDDEPQKDDKKKEDKPKDDSHDIKAVDSHNTPSQPPFDPHQQQQYAPPPAGSHSQSPLPPGWSTQFDQSSQRWYYIEQATGRTQWDVPVSHHAGYAAPPPPGGYGQSGPGYEASRGHEGSHGAGGFYNQYGSAMPPGAMAAAGHAGGHDANAAQYYGHVKAAEKDGEKEKKKKDNGTRNMMLAGAGGLAVGGVAGAMIAADSDSDDGHHSTAAQPTYAPQPSYAPQPATGYGQDPLMAPLPAHDSDAESLHEAQQDYADAQRAAADSDASSSDEEALEEAREEVEEEREEYYDD
ncbi:hypothetical protein TI39_contig590g00002 [Zymoseptoria brevis]|uniref:WW domain-containing protein n=1 Tax=Zymoseptoria brevis TaxID=1047168 RepID=A0A0F4GHV1_9PEZI|nr:hypothetical protein TI39_contig590g00002 [Zymoseptoria brevis]